MTRKVPPRGSEMCAGCDARCCRRYSIGLTAYDIFRIVSIEGKAISDFVEVILTTRNDRFAFRGYGGFVRLVMKEKGGACVFLISGQEPGCSIERSKPSACLAYPFSLRSGKPILLADASCPPGNLTMADNPKMSRKILDDCRWEFGIFQEIVDDWNNAASGDEKLDGFLLFASREMELERTHLGSIYRKTIRSINIIRKC